MNESAALQAAKLKELLLELSPLIEEYTSRVCPDCRDVCCKQKRSFPDQQDALYAAALGETLPVRDPDRPPEGPCEFMGLTGCSTPRWLRPWRCTWYFCDPLLEAFERDSQKKIRRISSLVRQILDIRGTF